MKTKEKLYKEKLYVLYVDVVGEVQKASTKSRDGKLVLEKSPDWVVGVYSEDALNRGVPKTNGDIAYAKKQLSRWIGFQPYKKLFQSSPRPKKKTSRDELEALFVS